MNSYATFTYSRSLARVAPTRFSSPTAISKKVLKPFSSISPKISSCLSQVKLLHINNNNPCISSMVLPASTKELKRSSRIRRVVFGVGLVCLVDIIKFSVAKLKISMFLAWAPGAKKAATEKGPDLFPRRVLYSSHSRHISERKHTPVNGASHGFFSSGLFRPLVATLLGYFYLVNIGQYYSKVVRGGL